MLWESTEPQGALRDRFGLDSFDEAVSWLTKVLSEVWAIEAVACERIIISDNNAIAWVRTDQAVLTDQEGLVVKWSRAQEQFDKFAATAELIDALHAQGVPVAPPRASVDGELRVIVNSGPWPLSMTVQPAIEADLLDTSDETAVRAAGACLATLHHALATHQDSRLTGRTTGSEQEQSLHQRIETWLESHDAGLAPAASERLRDHLTSLPAIDVEPQLIHYDYRASNVLTKGSEVVAVLDFDEVGRDYCVIDLANAFVLLSTRFTKWQPTPAGVRETFLDGYQSVRPLGPLERQWLEVLVLWRGITAIPPGDDPAGWANAV